MRSIGKPALFCIIVSVSSLIFLQQPLAASQRETTSGFFEQAPEDILRRMTLDEKLGQILIFGFEETALDEEMKEWINTSRLGNIKIFLRNITSKAQLTQITAEIKHLTEISDHGIPPFIATDMEGGMVNHIRYDGIQLAPSAGLIGASYNCMNCTYASRLIALTLRDSGVNMNFAPCVDVLTNTENRVIGTRSYGSDPYEVYFMARAFILEHEKYGITAVAKHFPGHGMTDFDTHTAALSVGTERAALDGVHFFPYRYLIKEGVLNTCMVSHVVYTALDPLYPASLSPVIINGILRKELGFEGLVITDDLEMEAAQGFSGDIVKSFILAFRSGTDLILISHTKEKQRKLLETLPFLFEKGILLESDLDRKVLRIIREKQRSLGRFYSTLPTDPENGHAIHETTETLYEASKEGIVEISSGMFGPFTGGTIMISQDLYHGVFLAPISRFRELAYEYFPGWEVFYIRYNPPNRENIRRMKQYADQLKKYDLVIIGMVNEKQAAWARFCAQERIPFIVLSMENPYVAMEFTKDALFVAACFSPYSPEPEALFECVFGDGACPGRFPYE
ncbi:MAG: glycoside hydrolase family 3 protein [Spirochaetes bacterium]|nr:glycoside hydrolase family 3 protein [Spirochaetota bacterium]